MRRDRRAAACAFSAFVLAALLPACVDVGPVEPAADGPVLVLTFERLPAMDAATEGSYEAWVVDSAGAVVSAGRFTAAAEVRLRTPLRDPAFLFITVEPPGDADALPSLMKLIGGRFRADGRALLRTDAYLTPEGIPLEGQPGVHVLGTPSNGPGTLEDAGIWLADTRVDSTHKAFYQSFAPLGLGWTYEGWVVHDMGTNAEVWVSYGQFRPNNLRRARFRDDTGIGPFSGLNDWEQALQSLIRYPGDDFLANPHALPVPGGLPLPFDLNGNAAAGVASRWTHVITIEPWYEPNGARTEKPWLARPFFLRPYRNAIGEAAPGVARTIESHLATLPAGSARILTADAR